MIKAEYSYESEWEEESSKESYKDIYGNQCLRFRCKRNTLSRKATDLMDNLFCFMICGGDVCKDKMHGGWWMKEREVWEESEVVRDTTLASATTIIVLFSI